MQMHSSVDSAFDEATVEHVLAAPKVVAGGPMVAVVASTVVAAALVVDSIEVAAAEKDEMAQTVSHLQGQRVVVSFAGATCFQGWQWAVTWDQW